MQQLLLLLWLPITILLALWAYYLLPGGLVAPQMFVNVSVVLLLVFLIFLILRYAFLLWYSYLDHMEGLFENEESGYTPLVSIIVPAFNEEKSIDKTIENLLEITYDRYEIIIVDDGSTDQTYQKALNWQKQFGQVSVRVTTQPNRGKALALNTGINLARGEILFCMDADSRLTPQSVRMAVRHFVDPTVGAVAGHVQILNRRNLWTYLQSLEYLEGLNLVRRSQGFFRLINIIPGPCGAFRKDVLQEIGLYASDTYAEDCDITLRILNKGWKIRYEPKAIAMTEAPEKLLDLLKQRYRWTRGIFQAIKKNSYGLVASTRRFPGNPLILLYMVFEAIFWPFANILAHLLVIVVGFFFGFSALIVYWWVQLLIFDIIVAVYCVTLEKEDVRLVLAALIYRTFFIFIIDICKVMAIIEELIDVKMHWSKVERIGY